jgi:hypothetical protein
LASHLFSLPAVSACFSVADPKRHRVAVDALDIGLHVAELDRPWLDTPFLVQGFLIDSATELDTLRAQCRFVYVDLERSEPDAVSTLERRGTSALRACTDIEVHARSAAPSPRHDAALPLRDDLQVNAAARQRFRQFAREAAQPEGVRANLGSRLLTWIQLPLAALGMARQSDPGMARHGLRGLLPADVVPAPYPARRRFEEELPRARRVLAFGDAALRALFGTVRDPATANVCTDLGTVTTAAYALVDSLIDNPDALMWAAGARATRLDPVNHGLRVAIHLIALGRHLGLPRRPLAELALIGLLADVGKLRVPQALLDKPGMLTATEFKLLRLHVRFGLDVIGACAALPDSVEQGIAQHHERLDGSGYPQALRGDEISLYGRMAAIVDSYVALTTPRIYAAASSPQDALMNLCEWAGSAFDEPLVEQFVQTLGAYPVGTLVELSSGEIAAVLTRARGHGQRLRILTWPDRTPLDHALERVLEPSRLDDVDALRIVGGLPANAGGLSVDPAEDESDPPTAPRG